MKILSLNLWNINAPLSERMRNLEIFIEKTQPNIIAFQEVSRLSDGKLQVEDILRNNHYKNVCYRLSGFWGSRDEGLILASKDRAEIILDKPLPLAPNDMPRGLIGIRVLEGDNADTVIFNTHLAYMLNNYEWRRKQVNFIIAELNKLPSTDKVVICGDFNEDANVDNIYALMIREGFRDTYSDSVHRFTFAAANQYVVPALWPDRRIDYIFEKNIKNLVSHCVMCETDGFGLCSDHFGVFAEEC